MIADEIIPQMEALLDAERAAIAATQIYFLGQPMPFVFLAFAGAAVLMRRERWWAAAACMMLATIEPHLALPALIALCRPKAEAGEIGFACAVAHAFPHFNRLCSSLDSARLRRCSSRL